MNTLVKIFLLVIAVTSAVAGVLWFAKTQIEPPQAKAFPNAYARHMEETVQDILSIESMNAPSASRQLGEKFWVAMKRAEFFYKTQRLTAEKCDSLYDKALDIFAEYYPERALSDIREGWGCSVFKDIETQLNALRQMKHTNGSSVLTDAHKKQLSQLNGLIRDYHAAWAFTNRTGYDGNIESSRQRIYQAQTWAQKDYLSNCPVLVQTLNGMRGEISRHHHDALRARANRLYGQSIYLSREDFDRLYAKLSKDANEYINQGRSIYGSDLCYYEDIMRMADNARERSLDAKPYSWSSY